MTSKLSKIAVIGALAYATAYGTFHDNRGFPLLFNLVGKNTDSSGIVLGLFGNHIYRKVNGLAIGGIGNASISTNSEVNGLEASLMVNATSIRDIYPTLVRGVQASILYNEARAGSYGLQIGIWNRIIADDGTEISASPIIHWMNGYKPERKEAGR